MYVYTYLDKNAILFIKKEWRNLIWSCPWSVREQSWKDLSSAKKKADGKSTDLTMSGLGKLGEKPLRDIWMRDNIKPSKKPLRKIKRSKQNSRKSETSPNVSS